MLLSKNKTELLANFRELNLRIMFQILLDIKEQQLQGAPKEEHRRIDKLFDVMGNVSLLHNQIFHLSKEQASTNQIYDHVLRFHRIILEKSVNDYLNEKEEKEKLLKKESAAMSFRTLDIESNTDSFSEVCPMKEKEILCAKLNKQVENEKKKYLRVNRTLHCQSQRQIPSPIKLNKKPINDNTKDNSIKPNNNVIDSKQSAPILPNTDKKKKRSKLLFEETKPPLKKAFSKTSTNFHCLNTDRKYKWMPLSLYADIKTPKKRKKQHLLQIEKSFEKRQDSLTQREIGKPSSYAKYLLKKYKDVIDNYGEEIRHSLNTSAKIARSSSRKEESKEKQLIEITPYQNLQSNHL